MTNEPAAWRFQSERALPIGGVAVYVDAIIAALEALSNGELEALIDATYKKVPQTALGLLAWIDAACEWELNRRAGCDYVLQPPEAAIASEEDAVSIDAATALRAAFAGDSPAVRPLFDALIDLLTGGSGQKH